MLESELDALVTAGRRLLELDPERFRKVLTLAWIYLAIYDGLATAPLEVLELCASVSRTRSAGPVN